MTTALEGIRVLVVEDEFLVASLIEDMLQAAGCVVSPASRVAEALDAVDHETYDAAVLDVNLGGDRIDPVADALSRHNVPFIFVTGYSMGALPGEHAARPRLCKPFRMADLVGTLSRLVDAPIPKPG